MKAASEANASVAVGKSKAKEIGIILLIGQVVAAFFVKYTKVSDLGTSEGFFINSINLKPVSVLKTH